jgi:hypothetical protein
MDEKDRLKFLRDNNLEEKFNFNMSLVSFEKIPKEHIENFNKNVVINLL